MLAQSETILGLGAHVCPCCVHTLLCMPTHMLPCVCPTSQLAQCPVSLEPDVDGWTDTEEERHSTSQGLALQPNKHTMIDGFLVSD